MLRHALDVRLGRLQLVVGIIEFVEQTYFLASIGTAFLFHAVNEGGICLIRLTQLRFQFRYFVCLLSHRGGLRQESFELAHSRNELRHIHAKRDSPLDCASRHRRLVVL